MNVLVESCIQVLFTLYSSESSELHGISTSYQYYVVASSHSIQDLFKVNACVCWLIRHPIALHALFQHSMSCPFTFIHLSGIIVESTICCKFSIFTMGNQHHQCNEAINGSMLFFTFLSIQRVFC